MEPDESFMNKAAICRRRGIDVTGGRRYSDRISLQSIDGRAGAPQRGVPCAPKPAISAGISLSNPLDTRFCRVQPARWPVRRKDRHRRDSANKSQHVTRLARAAAASHTEVYFQLDEKSDRNHA